MNKKEFKEMIKYCFATSKKRKRFERAFKSWHITDQQDFLRELEIYTRTPIKAKVYYTKSNNTLRVIVPTGDYYVSRHIVGVKRGRRGDEVYATWIGREIPLI